MADAMPRWAQDEAWGWMMGTPQATGRDPEIPGDLSYSGGSYYWAPTGYSGPNSFKCMRPVEGPAWISSPFGDTEGRNGHAHTGIDLAIEEGHLVWTPFGGQVTFAGWNYYLGWMVVVENDGWQVLLGHLCCGENGTRTSPSGRSSISVAPGDLIRAGDVVGTSGNTGNSTGPHVHFEIRHCDRGGNCGITDPSAARLPGQARRCVWRGQY